MAMPTGRPGGVATPVLYHCTMLSYRHGFHAGNHADVLKHFILVQLIEYLLQKEKALYYVDTHAGAAQYALTDSTALKNSEFESGIARLWGRKGLPQALESYLAQVRQVNPEGKKLRTYPGSPQIALQMLRPHDRLRLFEKHTTEIRILQQNLATEGRRAIAYAGDGFEGLKATLPPPSRRGLVLIDPSYEDKGDYKRTKQTLVDALVRFATGTYAVWYPLVQRREARQLPNSLKLAGASEWLNVSLTVKAPAEDGYGLHGSGLFIANPPWTLAGTLRKTMPWLVDTLAQDHEATFLLETS